MKHILWLIIAFAMVFTQCTSRSEKNTRTGMLNFDPFIIQSELLHGTVQSEADTEKQELLVTVKLQNPGKENVYVEDITIETAEGYQAKSLDQQSYAFILNAGADTTIHLQVKPINNFELYMLTGESGKFKPLYYCFLFYKDDKTKNRGSIKTQLNISAKDFADYNKNYKQSVTAYKFHSTTKFTEDQKNYLQPLLKTVPFVYLSDQEIALAGLNFRLQTYTKGDSIYVSLFIVNHADFSIKINPDLFDIIVGNLPGEKRAGKVELEKISGAMIEANMLRKGDRAVISLSKYVKVTAEVKPRLILKDVFLLDDGHSLFYKNPELEQL